MIVKIKSRKSQSFRQLIEYMLHDTDRLSPKERGFVVAHGLRGNTVEGWVKQLKENEVGRMHRRKNSVVLTHEILSWHRDDSAAITPEKLEAMTREYIRLRGNGKFLAVPHYDKHHYHVHILVSGVDTNGKAMRLSRSELSELKRNIQRYQVERFPELSRSLPAHGRRSEARTNDKEVQYVKRTGKQTTREKVGEIVMHYRNRSQTDEEFFALLSDHDMAVYHRGGRPYGVLYDGRKYRFKTMDIELIEGPSEKDLISLHNLRKTRGKTRHR